MQVVTTRVLTDLGYQVLVAGSVVEALKVWRDHEEKIDLILTDYTFHGRLTGMDLLTTVQVRRPEMPVLIVSGSWLPDARKDPPLPANVNHLAKPYRKAEIAQTVRRLLDEHPPKSKPTKPRQSAR